MNIKLLAIYATIIFLFVKTLSLVELYKKIK